MSNKRILGGLGVLLAIIAAFSTAARAEMPGPDPAAVWTYITQTSPYQQWKMWPDHQGMQPGRAPHGPFHIVYVNDQAYQSTQPPLADGSIQVKESYTEDKKLAAISIMYKVKGYNPGAGDWFWANYDPDGKAGPYGQPNGCISCHGVRANNDYVTVHEFK